MWFAQLGMLLAIPITIKFFLPGIFHCGHQDRGVLYYPVPGQCAADAGGVFLDFSCNNRHTVSSFHGSHYKGRTLP